MPFLVAPVFQAMTESLSYAQVVFKYEKFCVLIRRPYVMVCVVREFEMNGYCCNNGTVKPTYRNISTN